MRNYIFAAALAAVNIAPVAALPGNDLNGRTACNRDLCFRGILASPSSRFLDCTSYMTATVTPCASTVTTISTLTVTSTVTGNFPMKRDESAIAVREAAAAALALDARAQTPACAAITSRPTSLPAFAVSSCTTIGTTAPPGFRFSSACACNGVTATTTTLPAQTSTVTSTATATATATLTPPLFILQSSGDQSLYVTTDASGALRLTRDNSTAVPFYVDAAGQMRNFRDPARLMVDYYEPDAGTADNKVYSDYPSDDGAGDGANYGITCDYVGRQAGDFWGSCQASGPPNGNPVVYGFGTCPGEGYYVYMIPNNSNVRCGGYAFIGFFLVSYTGS